MALEEAGKHSKCAQLTYEGFEVICVWYMEKTFSRPDIWTTFKKNLVQITQCEYSLTKLV